MEQLSRYDVARYNGVLMVVVESDLLPPDPTRPDPAVVVIPLLPDYPAVPATHSGMVHEPWTRMETVNADRVDPGLSRLFRR